ncbi:MAG: hypothetical protein J5864_02135 [Oscillospiraceae bacterium]|nr:hypothetical protein [Oscillospiraceae bacterium]
MNNEKTSIGIPVALMGAALYFTMQFGGTVAFLILAAYVFLIDKNDWLKRVAVKAFSLSVVFSIIYAVLGLLPDLTGVLGSFLRIFNTSRSSSLEIPFLSPLVSCLRSCLNMIEKVFFLLLGFQAMKKSDIAIAPIDKIADQVTGVVSNAASKVSAAVNINKEEAKAEEPKQTDAE